MKNHDTTEIELMKNWEDLYKERSGLVSRNDYKLYYSRITKGPILIIGLNPGGNVGPDYKAASKTFYENWEYDYKKFETDPGYKIAGPMMNLLRPLSNKINVEVSAMPKTNMIFRRSPRKDQLGISEGQALEESQPILNEIMEYVEPTTIILEGKVTGDLFKKRYCKYNINQIGEAIIGPNGRYNAVMYLHEEVSLTNGRNVALHTVGHPSIYGRRKSWQEITKRICEAVN
jgi:hypothetical protein